MNRENLQRMADYIRTIPQEKFSMAEWRKRLIGAIECVKECNTVGCVIGHCTVLDPRPVSELPQNAKGNIHFRMWSEEFTGLDAYSPVWDWLFDSGWTRVDNTPEGAALRIERLLNYGLPADWERQMSGTAPLCYK